MMGPDGSLGRRAERCVAPGADPIGSRERRSRTAQGVAFRLLAEPGDGRIARPCADGPRVTGGSYRGDAMNAGASMVRMVLGAVIGAVVSSTVAAPWRLPEPLQQSVRYTVDAVTDLWLWWGYGVRERPSELRDEPGPMEHGRPLVKQVRAATRTTWRSVRRATGWLIRRGRTATAFLAHGAARADAIQRPTQRGSPPPTRSFTEADSILAVHARGP